MKEHKYIDKIIKLYNNQNYKDAKKKLEELLLSNKDDTYLLNLKGIICRAIGDYQNSLASYEKAISLDKKNPSFLNNRGNLYRDFGDLKKARRDYSDALKINSNYFEALTNLILLEQEEENYKEAEKLCLKAIKIEQKSSKGYRLLAISQLNQKKFNDAIENFKKSQYLQFDVTVDHQLALLQGKEVETTPIEYIENTFDNYSENFDNHLMRDLEYKLPELIDMQIKETIGKKKFKLVLDIGCGTGLCGKYISNYSDNIIGVDISAKMLKQAEKKNIYSQLIKEDFINYIKKTNNEYELIIASDVFIYTGNISKVFNLMRKKIKKGTYFIFSTELLNEDNFKILKTGRFAHSQKYIEEKCKENLYEIISSKTIKLRKEDNIWIKGKLYTIRI
tara:strand:- start:198 stop:1373 length:1176 start_codon:yes stop_codon:yes gene_type:complete